MTLNDIRQQRNITGIWLCKHYSNGDTFRWLENVETLDALGNTEISPLSQTGAKWLRKTIVASHKNYNTPYPKKPNKLLYSSDVFRLAEGGAGFIIIEA